MSQSEIVVHNAEDAETYLLLGFTVVMPMSVVRKLRVENFVIHAENYFNGWPPQMRVWISRKAEV